MKNTTPLVIGLSLTLLGAVSLRADDLATADHPYNSISERNAFNLVPPPPEKSSVPAGIAEPAAKITPNGIMSLFGAPQVLFDVTSPVGPGQGKQVQSYVMHEGDQADGITVTRIDPAARLITFDNHGTIQTLALADADEIAPPAIDPSATPANPPANQNPRGNIAAHVFASASAPADPNLNPDSANNAAPANDSSDSAANASNNDANQLSPEAQVVLIEAQREKLLQSGSPIASLIPPSPMTPLADESEQTLAGGPATQSINP